MAREVTAATRIVIVCNPNNPTATALPPAAIDAFVAGLPRHVAVILDEAYVEFSTLQDPDDSLGPARAAPQPGAAAHLLQGLRPVRPARRLRARLRGLPPGGGPRAPAVLGERAGPGRGRRGAPPPGRGASGGWSARRSSACTWRRSSSERGLETTDSQANFSWVSLGDRDEAGGGARAGGARRDRARAAPRSGGPGWLRVTYGTRAGERPLPGGARRGALRLETC